jgi:hypothetical protein
MPFTSELDVLTIPTTKRAVLWILKHLNHTDTDVSEESALHLRGRRLRQMWDQKRLQ